MDSNIVFPQYFQMQKNFEKFCNPLPTLAGLSAACNSSWEMANSIGSIIGADIVASTKIWSDMIAPNKLRNTSLNVPIGLSFGAIKLLNSYQDIFPAIGIDRRLQDYLKLSSAWGVQNKFTKSMEASSRLQNQLRLAIRGFDRRIQIDSLKEVIQEIDNENSELKLDDISLDESGSLAFAGDLFNLEEVDQKVADIVDELGRMREEKKQFFDQVLKRLEKDSKSYKTVVMNLLVTILIGILVNLVTPYISEQINLEVKNNKQTAVREIKKQTSKQFNFNSISVFRFVTANKLVVRAKSSQRAQKLDELIFGQVVQVVRKKKNWCFVMYVAQGDKEVCKGWVFTRYIKKF